MERLRAPQDENNIQLIDRTSTEFLKFVTRQTRTRVLCLRRQISTQSRARRLTSRNYLKNKNVSKRVIRSVSLLVIALQVMYLSSRISLPADVLYRLLLDTRNRSGKISDRLASFSYQKSVVYVRISTTAPRSVIKLWSSAFAPPCMPDIDEMSSGGNLSELFAPISMIGSVKPTGSLVNIHEPSMLI
jgi:hypothetical protein